MSVSPLRPTSYDPATEPTIVPIRTKRGIVAYTTDSADLAQAVRDFYREADAEAADLIRAGFFAPACALVEAENVVRSNREGACHADLRLRLHNPTTDLLEAVKDARRVLGDLDAGDRTDLAYLDELIARAEGTDGNVSRIGRAL